jgi:hypothetical protein
MEDVSWSGVVLGGKKLDLDLSDQMMAARDTVLALQSYNHR